MEEKPIFSQKKFIFGWMEKSTTDPEIFGNALEIGFEKKKNRCKRNPVYSVKSGRNLKSLVLF